MTDEASLQHPGLGKDNAGNAILSGCEVITVDTISNPKTMTIDFGPTGCVGNDGRTRLGMVKITYTGYYRKAGAVIMADFNSYRQLQGNDTITFTGKIRATMVTDWGTGRKINVIHDNLICKYQDRTWTWNGDRTWGANSRW